MRFQAFKPIRYIGPLPPLKIRQSGRKAAAAAKPPPFEEIRGVHVYTYTDRIVVSDGVYTTARYAERLIAAGGHWADNAWMLPAGADVRCTLDPHGAIAAKVAIANRPSWTCCDKAKVLGYKSKHYSCSEHTMYWEDCIGTDGQPIKILYAASTCGGGPYTGN